MYFWQFNPYTRFSIMGGRNIWILNYFYVIINEYMSKLILMKKSIFKKRDNWCLTDEIKHQCFEENYFFLADF